MGYIELYNIDNDGGWTDLNDIPFIETIMNIINQKNFQICSFLTLFGKWKKSAISF